LPSYSQPSTRRTSCWWSARRRQFAQTGASAGSQAVALAVFVAIGTIGPGAPVAIYFAMGDRSKGILEELRGWMSQNNGAIMAVICLVIGAKLIGDGISGFSG
jgi:hypothetical protein